MPLAKHLEEYKFKKGRKPWNYNRVTKICPVCNTKFSIPSSHAHKRFTCSPKCAGKLKTQNYLLAVKDRTEKKCYRCKRILPLNAFHKHKQKPDGLYPSCKECHKKGNQEYVERNRKKIRKKQRDYQRKHRIGRSNGDIRKVKNKRPYPEDESCEICKKKKYLVYHHWDDSDFSKGFWTCIKCHTAIHWLEEHDQSEYFSLKEKINALPLPS